MRRRAANAVAALRRFPTTARAKRWARYTAAAVAAAGVVAGGLAYSPSFRRQFAAYVLPARAFVTNYQQHHRKQSLFASLHGRVLELGPGVGANFAYFPPFVQWQGVEHNPELLPALYRNAADAGISPALLDVHVQPLSQYLRAQPSNSLDAVVSTYVLSSVPEYREVVAEVHRVLKPGGRFYFVENVARESGSVARGLQYVLNPLYRMFDGGDLMHETDKAIASVGFDRIATEWWGPKTDWPAANAQARAQRRAARAARRDPTNTAAVAAAAAPIAVSTSASGSVLPHATGTRPVIAGIAVKSTAAPAAAANANASVFPAFNYGLFQQHRYATDAATDAAPTS